MTTIIAQKTDGVITFGWDSQTTAGDRPITRKVHKVFSNSGIIMAVSGDSRVSDILRYATLPVVMSDTERYLVNELIPAIISLLEGADKFKDGSMDADILVSVNNELFWIAGDGCLVSDKTDRFAIGSGGMWALAYLDAGKTMREALEYAAEQDIGTGGPFYIKTVEQILENEN